MATQARVNGGEVTMVYDDRFRCLLEAVGTLTVERATEVEFDDATQQWVAMHLASGQIIARGKNRNQVIAQEVAWLEKEQL